MNIRILASVLLLTGCERAVPDERSSSLFQNQNSAEEIEIVAAQAMSFVLEYPSPPPADSGAQFHEAIKDLSKLLTEEGIVHATQGFLGNNFFVHGSAEPAKRALHDYAKTSPFKLHFLPQSDGEQDGAGQPSTRSESKGFL